MRRILIGVLIVVAVSLAACSSPNLPKLPANPTYGQMVNYCWAALQSVNGGKGGLYPEQIYRDCMTSASRLAGAPRKP